jgi:hypothetical protein
VTRKDPPSKPVAATPAPDAAGAVREATASLLEEPTPAAGTVRTATASSLEEPTPAAPASPPLIRKESAVTTKKRGKADAVLQRGRQMVRSERRKLWAKLGLEGDFDDAQFDQKLEEFARARTETASAVQENSGELARIQKEARELRVQNARLKAEALKTKREATKKVQQLEEEMAESEIRAKAAAHGFIDPDWGMELLRRHVRAHPPENGELNVEAFFDELKGDRRYAHLFGASPAPESSTPAASETPAPAGPKTLAEQAANQQRQEAEREAQRRARPAVPDANPKPETPGAGELPDANKMTSAEFQKYAREKYGTKVSVSPGAVRA